MPIPRQSELHRRRTRHRKLKRLRERYAHARTREERDRIWEKVRRINPMLRRETFEAAVPRRPRREEAPPVRRRTRPGD